MINLYGWCINVNTDGQAGAEIGTPKQCVRSKDAGGADNGSDGRFDKSYGRWGGYELQTNGSGGQIAARYVWKTTQIICK